MLKARAMVEKGATAYGAAKANGLTTGAITRSQWYKDRPKPVVTSPTDAARVLVVEQGYTAHAAAKRVGIAQSSISRAKWYREFKEKQS
jgi:hypothetical protein